MGVYAKNIPKCANRVKVCYEVYNGKESSNDEEEMLIRWTIVKETQVCTTYILAIIFIDGDLLLGSKPHNHPLFDIDYAHEYKLNRIFLDSGSVVNILPCMNLSITG